MRERLGSPIRHRCHNYPRPVPDAPIGEAPADREPELLRRLVDAADAALYQVKAADKVTFRFSEPPVGEPAD